MSPQPRRAAIAAAAIVLLVVIVALFATQPASPSPTPSPVAQPSPTATPTASPSATPIPTPSPTQTAAPTPTAPPAATQQPTAAPNTPTPRPPTPVPTPPPTPAPTPTVALQCPERAFVALVAAPGANPQCAPAPNRGCAQGIVRRAGVPQRGVPISAGLPGATWVSDANGFWSSGDLPPGTWNFFFGACQKPGVMLAAGQITIVNFP